MSDGQRILMGLKTRVALTAGLITMHQLYGDSINMCTEKKIFTQMKCLTREMEMCQVEQNVKI